MKTTGSDLHISQKQFFVKMGSNPPVRQKDGGTGTLVPKRFNIRHWSEFAAYAWGQVIIINEIHALI